MSIEIGPDFARLSADLIARYRRIGSSTVGNVLDDLNVPGIMTGMRPLVFGTRIVGHAFTAREICGVKGTFTGAEFGLGKVIDAAGSGDVICIDNGGHAVSTWGGIASMAALRNGVEGLVVDGGVRDADEIAEFGLGTFSRHVLPLSGKTRVKVVAINTVIRIDNVMVRPGDIIVGDSTGIVCVPADLAEEVLEKAEKLERDDRQAIEDIEGGCTFTEALAKFAKL